LPHKRKREDSSIPKHRHCPVCGVSIDMKSQFCSVKCKNEYERIMKKRKRLEVLTTIFIISLTVFFIIRVIFL